MTSTNFALAGTQVEAQTYRASRKDAITAKRANVQTRAAFFGARLPSMNAQRMDVHRSSSTIICAATTEIKSLGPDKWNDTYYPTASDAAAVHKKWYIIDAEGQTLGRLAALAANYIRGKNSVGYTPSMDMGAYVIIINADKVAVTGRKETDKLYHRHTVGRPGGWKVETLQQLRARIPERILEKAVKGMLPKGRLGNALFSHLKVYKGSSHPHGAQQPMDITSFISKKPSEMVV